MIKLVCSDFDVECDYEAVGTVVSQVMELFVKHASVEHGKRHSKDEMLFILRNQSKNNISKKEVEDFFNGTYKEINRLEKWKIGRKNFS